MATFNEYMESIGEYGVVEAVRFPIATINGLPHVHPNEMVLFEDGQKGEVFSINPNSIEVLILGSEPPRVGTQVVRTGQALAIPVGKELLGHIVDPLGRLISTDGEQLTLTETREVDHEVESIQMRTRIRRPFNTGVSMVDMMIPLGKGQRELIAGDRKTGKTAFLLSAIKTQIHEGSIVVYGMVASRLAEVKRLQEHFRRERIDQNVIMVVATSHDSPSSVYLAPYAAMTIAEYFRDLGLDVLVVLDDLSAHARFYRELSLLADRFPGRDSYPGDIFYLHAKLIERAGNFRHPEKGEVSITCLPVVETIEGDLSGYIVTNLMGMTDGHIFFDSNAYYNGRRPAVNTSMSVTRVGRQTQTNLRREVNHELSAFLANYEKSQNYSHFGAELSDAVRETLKTGEKILAFFDQHYNLTIPEEVQLILFAMIWLGVLPQDTPDSVLEVRKKLIDLYLDDNRRSKLQAVTKVETMQDLLLNVSRIKEELVSL